MEFSIYINDFALVCISMFFAVLSPGPDFAFILKQGISYGRKASIYTSLGIGIAVSFHIIYTIIGISLIISQSLILFTIIKFLGAIYLIYLGYKSFNSKEINLEDTTKDNMKTMNNRQAFMLGLLCNILNPKAAMLIISIFTVTISINTPTIIQGIYGIACVFIALAWYIFLAFILSQEKIRIFFNNFGKWFDKTIGVILISLGIKVAFSKL